MQKLSKYSIGMGDRFAHQADWQLKVVMEAEKTGHEITPVWNKSNREHTTIGSEPRDVRKAAQQAIQKAGWTKPWFIDADHINLDTVERFIDGSDFFTIDVAAYSIMSNHYHIVVRVDRVRVADLSTHELIRRWAQLYQGPLIIRRYLSEKRNKILDTHFTIDTVLDIR